MPVPGRSRFALLLLLLVLLLVPTTTSAAPFIVLVRSARDQGRRLLAHPAGSEEGAEAGVRLRSVLKALGRRQRRRRLLASLANGDGDGDGAFSAAVTHVFPADSVVGAAFAADLSPSAVGFLMGWTDSDSDSGYEDDDDGLAAFGLGPDGPASPSSFHASSTVLELHPDVDVRAAVIAPALPVSLLGWDRERRRRLQGGVDDLPPDAADGSVASTTVSWGLDRVDQIMLPLDGSFHHLPGANGSNVDIYMVDSGVRETHLDLVGRVALPGYNAVPDRSNNTDASDCAGHGTHIAATAVGLTLGLAKGASIIPVRVYGCEAAGPLRQILDGFEWVKRRIAERGAGGLRRSVINLSFAADKITLLDNAIVTLAETGAVIVAAAGNSASDACATSPASSSRAVPSVLTVASSDRADTFSDFSDHGECVSLVAPGREIISASFESDTGLLSMSGTSMAAPHVAGFVAVLLSVMPQETAAADVARAVKCLATSGQLNGFPDLLTPNSLLYAPVSAWDRACVPSLPGLPPLPTIPVAPIASAFASASATPSNSASSSPSGGPPSASHSVSPWPGTGTAGVAGTGASSGVGTARAAAGMSAALAMVSAVWLAAWGEGEGEEDDEDEDDEDDEDDENETDGK
jgi:subtilisin family serine protease